MPYISGARNERVNVERSHESVTLCHRMWCVHSRRTKFQVLSTELECLIPRDVEKRGKRFTVIGFASGNCEIESCLIGLRSTNESAPIRFEKPIFETVSLW